ncbi:Chaperone protein like [Actinidia chinensis var. chinensis]|uniref:Chaperone protein like n=1 Tax=Actinidia chinensis var. chinensis TaxID=1590841 RepID=A0A2R6PW47_ACTCC|nr:Chaperone protein like [Actinidia chinensis var. chinensis]
MFEVGMMKFSNAFRYCPRREKINLLLLVNLAKKELKLPREENGGEMDVRNLLNSMLSQGELQCVGACYCSWYIENSDLEQRFQKI